MRIQTNVVALLFAITLISCRKDIPHDYRDKVVGTYNGIEIFTIWQGGGFYTDTTTISIQLKKSSLDSIVDMSFGPTYENVFRTYKYIGGDFIPIDNYHAPHLEVTDDSLVMHHQPGLGPAYYDYFAKKID